MGFRDLDFNLDLTGFNEDELAAFLAGRDAISGLTDEDAVPDVPETAASVAGNLWLLGNHKLLVGDATTRSEVDPLMAGDAADLVFTDPPYIEGDCMTPEQFHQFLAASFANYRAIIKPGASFYVFVVAARVPERTRDCRLRSPLPGGRQSDRNRITAPDLLPVLDHHEFLTVTFD
jgi:hypothetical protein